MSHSRIVIEVSSGIGTVEDERSLGRILEEAQRLKKHGDDIRLIFDGAGTRWLPKIVKSDHHLHVLFTALRELSPAACKYCASTFGVEKAIHDAGIILLDDYHNHSNLSELISQKYQTITV